jgi:hypothetical protein
MKEGAGEDPFAEDSSGVSSESEPSTTATSQESSLPGSTETSAGNSTSASTTTGTDNRDSTVDNSQVQIPYKYRRDGVQDGRDRVPLFLHEETKNAERDALRQLEDHFGENVSLTDLREAVVKVGINNLEEVEIQLEDWGYGMTFDD